MDGSEGFEGIEIMDEDWHRPRPMDTEERGEFEEKPRICEDDLKMASGK
jgi:hypothetical protein